MTTSPIASSIAAIFPAEKAQHKITKNPSLTPFFSLASGKSEKKVIDELKQTDCNYSEPKYGLTLLAVSTILRKYEVMNFLLHDRKVEPNPIDRANLTPRHYAHIHNDKRAGKLLEQAQLTAESTSDFFQMYPGWKKVLKPDYPKESETVFFFKNEQGDIVPGTPSQFFEQTQAKFYDGVTADPRTLRSLWAEQLEKSPRYKKNPHSKVFNDYLCAQWLLLKNDPKKIYIGKQGTAGHGIFAGEKLFAGKPFCIYGGKVFDADNVNRESDFVFNQVDAKDVRNLPSMINDGFPNCNFFHVQLPDGRSYEVLVPLRDIEPGEGLFWNYGYEHEIKFRPRGELNSEEFIKFFSSHSLKSLYTDIANEYRQLGELKDLTQVEAIALKLFELERKQICLRYIFHTPNAFISLFFHDLLTLEDMQFFLKNPFFQYLMGAKQLEGLVENIQSIEKHLELLSERFPDDIKSKDFKNFFIGLCNKYSYHTVCTILEYLKKEKTSSNSWSEVRLDVEKFTDVLENIHAAIFWDSSKSKNDFSAYWKELSKLPPSFSTFTNHHLTKKSYNNADVKKRLQGLQSA